MHLAVNNGAHVLQGHVTVACWRHKAGSHPVVARKYGQIKYTGLQVCKSKSLRDKREHRLLGMGGLKIQVIVAA